MGSRLLYGTESTPHTGVTHLQAGTVRSNRVGLYGYLDRISEILQTRPGTGMAISVRGLVELDWPS